MQYMIGSFFFIFVTLLSMSGCSNIHMQSEEVFSKNMYESLQDYNYNKRSRNPFPYPSGYQERTAQLPYEEYRRERENEMKSQKQ